MSKPIQTVEELEAVLHWRGKHALAIRERDALQQLLNQRDEQVESLERQREAELRNGQDRQLRLTAADERADVLEGLVRRTLEYFTESGMPEDLLAEFKAALARVATDRKSVV